MASTMPACASLPKGLPKVFAALSLLLLAACADRNGEFGFEVRDVKSWVSGQHLQIALLQKISLSPDARSALQNGVPLHIEVLAELATGDGKVSASRGFEIRYMPLSDHYQLSSDQPAFVRTYPRLRHVLAELSEVELDMPLPDVPPGDYQLLTRSWLEKRSLPPPMRLPAWFSPNWQHDSGWQSRTVQIAESRPSAGRPSAP